MVLWRPTAIQSESTYRVSGDDKRLEQRKYYSFYWTELDDETWKVFLPLALSERVGLCSYCHNMCISRKHSETCCDMQQRQNYRMRLDCFKKK